LALCASNISTPTIKKPSDHFNPVLYTGNGSTQSITGAGFQPDLVWIKNRSASDNHKLTDAVRGVTKELESNTLDAEVTNADALTAFGSDGFSLGDDDEYNTNTENYVSWNWKANGSGSSDEAGSINVTRSTNTDAGFSIISYTGNDTDGATISHGLGAVPHFILVKKRTGTDGWGVLHWDRGTPGHYNMELNTTSAGSDSNIPWNDTAPTSSLITLNGNNYANSSSYTYIMYAWAEIAGFSKFGKYLGNGDTNGSVIRLGFKPAFVIVKKSSSSGSSWFMWDNKRDSYNPVGVNSMWADAVNGDTDHSSYYIDFLSNGFKLRGTNAGSNASGGTIMYMAWAEAPLSYSTAR